MTSMAMSNAESYSASAEDRYLGRHFQAPQDRCHIVPCHQPASGFVLYAISPIRISETIQASSSPLDVETGPLDKVTNQVQKRASCASGYEISN